LLNLHLLFTIERQVLGQANLFSNMAQEERSLLLLPGHITRQMAMYLQPAVFCNLESTSQYFRSLSRLYWQTKYVELVDKLLPDQKNVSSSSWKREVCNIARILNQCVTIRTFHTHYVLAHPGGEVDVQREPNAWGKFFIIALGNGQVAIRTAHNTYLRSHPGGEGAKVDQNVKLGDWETFRLIRPEEKWGMRLPKGKWSFKSCHGTFLRADPHVGARLMMQVHCLQWETYDITLVVDTV
jgi:hypothetical protein